MKKCVFFDRDGIVNRSPGPGYVERWEDFVLLPEFVEVLRLVGTKGYEGVVVTNQRGVARGMMTLEVVNRIHVNLKKTLRQKHGLELLDILCCPHNEGECECRKPKPGMLQEAARRHDLDLARSWMIGDSATDVEAGRRAGCRTIFVGRAGEAVKADFTVRDLTELKSLIEKQF